MPQQTFDRVPEIGQGYQLLQERRDAPISRPPMTSKMAKKQYNKKTATKKLSRQEERMEQLRIKAELRERDEREKRERKAEAVRQKKREKELRMKEERKKKGLPLVDVRPSQEMLTRFFRGNGSEKKRDSTGAAVRLEAVQEETSGAESDTSATEKASKEQALHLVQAMLQEEEKAAAEVAKLPPPKPFKRFRSGCTPQKADNYAIAGHQPVRPPSVVRSTVSPCNSDPKLSSPGPESQHEDADSDEHTEEDENETGDSKEDKETEEHKQNPPLARSQEEGYHEDTIDMAREWEQQAAVRHDRRYGLGAANSRKTCMRNSYRRQEDYDPYLESCFSDLSDPEDNPVVEFGMLMDELAALRRNDRLAATKKEKTSAPCRPSARNSGTPGATMKTSAGKENKPPQPAQAPPARVAGQPVQPVQPRPVTQAQALKDTSGNGGQGSRPVISAKPSMAPPPLPTLSKSSLEGMVQQAISVSRPVVTPVSRPLLRQATYGSAKQTVHTGGSDMPSCTQLLNISMADLVDFLPSPSQEVLELEGPSIAQPPAVSVPLVPKPQAQALKPKPLAWKPPPPVWKPARPPAPSAAPPSRRQVAPLVEDFSSFFSTQDFMFSSQDIREVETPNRLQQKPAAVPASRPFDKTPALKPSTLAPRPASSRSARTNHGFLTDPIDDVEDPHGHKPRTQAASPHSIRGVLTGKPIQAQSALVHAARYGRRSSQAGTPQLQSSMQSSGGLAHETPCRAQSSSVRNGAHQATGPRSVVGPTSAPVSAKEPAPSLRRSVSPAKRYRQGAPNSTSTTPQPSASPPRKRLLTSSNIPLLVAEERSRKSYREEQRKRQLEEQEAELLRRKEEGERKKREADDLRLLQEEADKAMMGNSSVDDFMNDDFFLEHMFSQRMCTALSQAKVDHKTNVGAASQETDYGDLDFPGMTQFCAAPTQGKRGADAATPGRVKPSQETDYGDVDLDEVGEDIEGFLKQVDFTDDLYP